MDQTLRELSFFTGRGGRLSVMAGCQFVQTPPPLPVKNDTAVAPLLLYFFYAAFLGCRTLSEAIGSLGRRCNGGVLYVPLWQLIDV